MQLERRAEIHAALDDSEHLAIVDEPAASDRSPSELGAAPVEQMGTRPTATATTTETP